MILVMNEEILDELSFTRIGGDDPELVDEALANEKFYPHRRGWSYIDIVLGEYWIVLPA